MSRTRALLQRFRGSGMLAATVTVGAVTAVTKIASMAKDVYVARQFGTGDLLDAFFIAYLLPSFVISIVAGALNAALIPVFVRVRIERGAAEVEKLLSSVLVASTGGFAILALLMAVTAPWLAHLIASGFNPVKLALTTKMLRYLLFLPLFAGARQVRSSALNAEKRFAVAAAVPAITPMVMLLCIALLAHRLNVQSLIVGVLAGAVLENLVVKVALQRIGIRAGIRWRGADESLRQIGRQYLPMVAGSIFMGSTAVIDQSMSARLGSGAVSAINYANKLPSAILSMSAMAIGSAAIPFFSELIARNDWEGLRATIRRWVGLIFACGVPLTVALFVCSGPLVRAVFQRGAFGPGDTAVVARAQACYFVQTPFYIAGILLVRLISSASRNDILMWGSAISMVLNVVLDLLFMRWMGVAGIALSTSVVYIVSFLYLFGSWARLQRMRLPISEIVVST